MAARRMRVRALVLGACALLTFQAGYVPPVAQAALRTAELPASPRPLEDKDGVDPATGLQTGATEIPSARTEYSQTFANPDGTQTTQFYADPAFYRPAGSDTLEPIALGFEPAELSTGDFVSNQAPVSVAVSSSGPEGDFLSTSYQGRTIGFRLPEELARAAGAVAPTIDGPVADYADLMPGVDLRVIANAHGAKSFFVWRESPIDPTIKYVVDAPELKLAAQEDGSIALVDANGTSVAAIPVPYAVDSAEDGAFGSGHYTNAVSLALGADGQTVTVSVDPEWLKSAVYPVYVDPSTGWIYNAGSSSYGDAFVDSIAPTTNFGDYQRPDSPFYHELWNGVSPADGGNVYDFLRWDLSAYAGVTVDSASLRLYPYHQYYNAPTAETTYVRRVTSSWTEGGVTWNTKPTYTSTGTVTVGCVEGSYCTFNVTAIAQLWLQGISPSSNYGFQVDTIGKNDTFWKRFVAAEQGGSNRPALSITYHTPTATSLYPTSGAPTSDKTLSWAYADPGSDPQTHYHVDLATDSAFTQNLVTSGDVASAATSWAVPSALVEGTTYWWRVKSYNGTGWSPWSTMRSFVYSLSNLGLQSQFRTEDFDLGGGDRASVNVSTGNLVLSHPIVSLPIRGSSVALGLTYNSQDPATVGMGPGWRLNVHRRLDLSNPNQVTFIDGDGARYVFTSPQVVGSVTTYTRPVALFANLKKDTSQGVEFTLTYRDLSRDTFDISGTEGLLIRSEDRHANGVTLAYLSSPNRINTITDTAGGRSITFAYDGSNRVTSITDWAYVDGSGVVQTGATGSHRVNRFFYDGSGKLAGWADALNTSGSCPTGATHVTCVTYGATLAIAKTLTVETISGSALTTTTPVVTTQVSLVGTEVTAVKDAEQVAVSGPATTFARGTSQMVVVRPGTPPSTTTYGFVAETDTYARVQSVWRLLGTNIEHRTVYDSAYPTLPASETDNYVNGVAGDGAATVEDSIINYTYQASSLGLLSRLAEPLDATYRRYTDYAYNANNDVTQQIVSRQGDATLRTTTRYCYTTSGCLTTGTELTMRAQIDNYVDGAPGGANGHAEDVTTSYQYDAHGQRTRQTRSNYRGSTLLDSAAKGWTYDSYGNVTAEIRNYIDGLVSGSGDDITPNATTNARTDLTTAYGYDTAGNRVTLADPRRAIESAKGTALVADDYVTLARFDALNHAVISQLPTTPTVLGGSDCTPAGPSCRQSPTTYDEFGHVRETKDYGGLVTASKYDRVGRATETYEDTDGAGGAAAAITSKSAFDTQGRLLRAWDREQAKAGAVIGCTLHTYDALGRETDITEGSGTTPCTNTPGVSSITRTTYDNLDRMSTQETGYGTGTGQTTTWTYDIGGRTTQLNDEFTCSATTYDYRDLALTVVEGKSPGSPCTGAGTRTITNAYDGLGRLLTTSVNGTSDLLTNDGYDSAGRTVYISQDIGGIERTSWFTRNPLDEAIIVERYKWVNPVVSEQTWLQSNYDAAGNNTDRCTWLTSPTVACLPADQAMSPEPTKRTTTGYDARNMRIKYLDPTVGETTYEPAANYQVKGVFIKTAAGKELQTIYAWDARNRLDTITHYLCATAERPNCTAGNVISTTPADDYGYDDNDNRTQVTENNGTGSATNNYCYDGLNRLAGTFGAPNCASPVETYAYDAAGNRTGAAGRTFTYDAQGQLATCTSPACTATHDVEGRLTQLVDNGVTWTYQYDANGRLTAACKASACSGSINRLDFLYGEEDHRVQVKETTSGGQVTTTDLKYEGDAVVQESTSTGVTRTFTLDEAGTIVKVVIAGDVSANNGTYLVTWNGHGDALALWKIDLSLGGLTLANSYTYSAWGKPTIATHNGIGDLGFRYLYVGRFGVASDDFAAAGLLHMGARHYSPTLGRFLQPDPSSAEANLYGYAGDNPITRVDPDGTFFWFVAIAVGVLVFGGAGAAVGVVNYAVNGDRDHTLEGAGNAALNGGTNAVSQASMFFPGAGLFRIGWGRFIPAIVTRTATRALRLSDFGARSGLEVVRGTFTVSKGVAKVSIDMVEASGNASLWGALAGLKATARNAGAHTLVVQGTLGNPRLLKALLGRYGIPLKGTLGSHQEIWVFKLRR